MKRSMWPSKPMMPSDGLQRSLPSPRITPRLCASGRATSSETPTPMRRRSIQLQAGELAALVGGKNPAALHRNNQ